MKNRMKVVLTLAAALVASPALAGSSAGNSTDLIGPYAYHAWFGGMNEATYCLNVSPTAGVSAQEVANAVEWSFAQWVDYMKIKHLSVPVAKKLSALPGAKCTGAEDLRVHVGTSDATIEKFKTHYLSPIAFAEKTEYNFQTGRGRGVLWLSEVREFRLDDWTKKKLDWKETRTLRAIVLHEMGHIFGTEHIPGTIMDSEIAFRVFNEGGHSGGAGNLPMDQIDGRYRELVSCRDCTYRFEDIGHGELQRRFKTIVGREAVGKVTASVILVRKLGESGTITLRDELGSYDLPFRVEKDIVWRNGDHIAFRAQGFRTISQIPDGTGVQYGWMIAPNGTKRPISVSRNLSYSLEIVDLDGEVSTEHEDDSDFFHAYSFEIVK